MNYLSNFILETALTTWTRLVLNSERPTYFCLPVLRLKACTTMFSLKKSYKMLKTCITICFDLFTLSVPHWDLHLPFQFDDLSLVRCSKPSSWNFVIGRKVFLCLNSSHSISWRLCKTTIVINTLCLKRIHGSKQTFQARSFNEVV